MKSERRSDILPKLWEHAQGLLPCAFFSDSHPKNHETAQGSRCSSTGWTIVFVWMVTFSSPAHAAPDPDIQSLVEGILEDSIRAVGERLVGFRTRFVGTNSNRSAGDWISARLLNAGYPEVRFEPFSISLDRTLLGRRFILDGVEGRNITIIKPGVLRPEKFVLLGAHYDSINLSNPGSVTQPDTTYAPGADDNATGTAVVLEIARLLFSTDLDLSVVFVLFDGEELGLWGSRSYAELIRERGDDISAVLNVDAIGTRSAEFPTAFTIDTSSRSLDLAEEIAQAAHDYTDLVPRNRAGTGPFELISTGSREGCNCSDHQAFLDLGYPAVGIHQYFGSVSRINTDRDTLEAVDFSMATEIGRVVLAAALRVAGFPGRSPDFNGDNTVDLPDFFLFEMGFGSRQGEVEFDSRLDLDRDGFVGLEDFFLFAGMFGRVF